MTKYLVTGGAGFIGSHLCDALLDLGHHVIALDNLSNGDINNLAKQVEFIKGDTLDAPLVNKVMKEVDGCFHLAAIPSVIESTRHWVKAHQVNASATVTILNAASSNNLNKKIPVVIASSCAVYGNSKPTPSLESEKITPISAYGADKLASEYYAYVATHQYKIPTVCLRIFNAYGSRQSPSSPYAGVISLFCKQFTEQKPISIYGDGEQVRDFVYVKDTVQFLIKSMQLKHDTALILNAATGRTTSINTLKDTLAELTKTTVQVNKEKARISEATYSCGDPNKAKKVLNFATQYTLQEGLQELLNANSSTNR